MSQAYKLLFENKFTSTHKKAGNFLQNLYYRFSAATYSERLMFDYLGRVLDGRSGLKIADLGCGGGHERLTGFGEVYGMDISFSSLENAGRIYSEVKEADLSVSIPYPDNFFDVIFCSSVLGHIASEDKDMFLQEVLRVSKPGAIAVFLVETTGVNFLTNLLMKKGLYQKYWIDYQGHIGLEKPEETVSRMKKIMTIDIVAPTSKTVQAADILITFTDRAKIFKLFENNLLRRIMNVVVYPVFWLSVKFEPIGASNGLVIGGKLKVS